MPPQRPATQFASPGIAPVRETRIDDDALRPRPVFVVWELTLKCDQGCHHCGSRAGDERPRELATAEILDVARAIARLGAREVALIGGEAYLRHDLAEIVATVGALGMRPTMQTGGRAFTPALAKTLKAAGLESLGVSIDGPARVHDKLRGNLGSHRAAIAALDAARQAGMIVSANSQLNRLNAHLLPEMAAELRAHGVQTWQVQLTGPMGRAADHPDWILEPWRVVEVIDTLASIQHQAMAETAAGSVPFNVFANNNVGYFGPHEQTLRSRPLGVETHWQGCMAGIFVLGIESDGTVKGCPTLPTAAYAAGNVLTASLEDIWAHAERIRFARDRERDELWGFCKSCYYADVCRGGCSWTAHTTLGRRGNNPFCYHRVTQLRRQGLRERLVPVERPPHMPYDHGRFELVEEPWPADEGAECQREQPS